MVCAMIARRGTLLFLSVAQLLALNACQRRPAARPASARKVDAAPLKLDLPQLTAPSPLPASRVVHLLYTANVVGDAEPCG
jgi:hypothetical protein